MRVIQPAGEAEGLEAGIGVEQDVAKLVIVYPLHGEAGGGLEDLPRAAQVVADDPVGHASFDQVVRHVGLRPIHEPGDHIAGAIEFRNGIQLILI